MLYEEAVAEGKKVKASKEDARIVLKSASSGKFVYISPRWYTLTRVDVVLSVQRQVVSPNARVVPLFNKDARFHERVWLACGSRQSASYSLIA